MQRFVKNEATLGYKMPICLIIVLSFWLSFYYPSLASTPMEFSQTFDVSPRSVPTPQGSPCEKPSSRCSASSSPMTKASKPGWRKKRIQARLGGKGEKKNLLFAVGKMDGSFFSWNFVKHVNSRHFLHGFFLVSSYNISCLDVFLFVNVTLKKWRLHPHFWACFESEKAAENIGPKISIFAKVNHGRL